MGPVEILRAWGADPAPVRGGGFFSLGFCSASCRKRSSSWRRGQSSMTPGAATQRGCFRVPALQDAVRNCAILSLAAMSVSRADPALTRHMAATVPPDKVEELYFAPPLFTIPLLLSRGWMRAPKQHDQKK